MCETQTKQDRAVRANALIAEIASCGRHFFNREGRVCSFDVDARGRVWFVDSWRGDRVYVMDRGRWRGFTHGGTLRTLVEQLRDYIRTGAPIWAHSFGPWPEYVCGGDLWGYGAEHMQRIRDAVVRIGIPTYTAGERNVAAR